LKTRVLSRTSVRILIGLAPCTVLALPLSCGDDTSTPATEAGGDVSTDTSSGGRETGPATDAAKEADATQTTEGGGDADAGPMDSTVSDADSSAASDAEASVQVDGDAAPQCTGPAVSTNASACLVFTPEMMNLLNGGDAGTDPRLDGMGRLLVQVYDTATPTIPTSDAGDAGLPQALVTIEWPPPLADGGMQPEVSVNSLPVIPIDGLPATVYIRAFFIDNNAWFLDPTNLTYGMWVGGMNLANGVLPAPAPPPDLRQVSLTVGRGTFVPMPMLAMRRFSSDVVLALQQPDGAAETPIGNGQGPLSVAVLEQAAVANAQFFGGVQTACTDMTKGPVPVTGFFYVENNTGDTYFGALLDDFGLLSPTVTTPPGALISLAPGQVIPPMQKVTVAADQYSVGPSQLPFIALTTVIPFTTTPPTDTISCPATTDAGSDAPSDAPRDAPDGG